PRLLARPRQRRGAGAARLGAGGTAAGGDRSPGFSADRAQSRVRSDDPAHRARHAGGDGARRAGAGAAPRGADRGRYARRRRARAGGGTILSRRGGGRLMLRVENLDVFHGDAQALDDVSLNIAAGSIGAIVGANGAGKTSLIRTIAGMHRPARGRIAFRDIDIGGWESHRVCNLGIGQVAEGRQVFPTLSVAENLDVAAMLPRARGQRAINL